MEAPLCVSSISLVYSNRCVPEGLRNRGNQETMEMIQKIKLTEWTRNRAAVMEVRTLYNDNEMKIVRHYEQWMERYEDQYQDDDDQY